MIIMKKIIVLFFLTAFTLSAFAQEPSKEGELQTGEVQPDADVIQSLQWQLQGLNIVTGSGQPGPANTIAQIGVDSINGDIEPLYVIDGELSTFDAFKKINPEDIVNISVLKDSHETSISHCHHTDTIVVKTKKSLTKRQLR